MILILDSEVKGRFFEATGRPWRHNGLVSRFVGCQSRGLLVACGTFPPIGSMACFVPLACFGVRLQKMPRGRKVVYHLEKDPFGSAFD